MIYDYDVLEGRISKQGKWYVLSGVFKLNTGKLPLVNTTITINEDTFRVVDMIYEYRDQTKKTIATTLRMVKV